jgi:hypothetical protein
MITLHHMCHRFDVQSSRVDSTRRITPDQIKCPTMSRSRQPPTFSEKGKMPHLHAQRWFVNGRSSCPARSSQHSRGTCWPLKLGLQNEGEPVSHRRLVALFVSRRVDWSWGETEPLCRDGRSCDPCRGGSRNTAAITVGPAGGERRVPPVVG